MYEPYMMTFPSISWGQGSSVKGAVFWKWSCGLVEVALGIPGSFGLFQPSLPEMGSFVQYLPGTRICYATNRRNHRQVLSTSSACLSSCFKTKVVRAGKWGTGPGRSLIQWTDNRIVTPVSQVLQRLTRC